MYESYFKMEENKYFIAKAIPIISKLFKDNDIEYCLIGGASLPSYKLNRATEDVDFLIFSSDRKKIEELIGIYFKLAFPNSTRKLIHNDSKVIVEFLFSGEETGGLGGIKFENPNRVSKQKDGINIITLEKLIEYKLSSGIYGKRLKDFGDVQELIKLNNLPIEFANSFRQDIKNKYIEIWSM
jgi:hypothetical protein